jgi:hypothetical protein
MASAIIILVSGCVSLPSIKEISPPELVLADISFEEIRIGTMKFNVWVDIRNINKVPLSIDYMKADLMIADSILGAADTDRNIRIDKFETKRVELEYTIGMAGATQTVIRLVQKRGFDYTIKGLYYFNTLEGLEPMPFEQKGFYAQGSTEEPEVPEEPEEAETEPEQGEQSE